MNGKIQVVISEAKELALVLLLALAIIAFAALLVYKFFMDTLDEDVVRIWALVATLLLPITGIVCFKLGKTESVGVVKGIETGVKNVVPVASQVADIRISTARAMRQTEDAPVIELPPLEAHYRLMPPADNGSVEL